MGCNIGIIRRRFVNGKFDPLRFWWFNLHLDSFFKEIQNIRVSRSNFACSIRYTQNGDWGMRRGSGHVLRLSWFNLCLDPFFERNPNLKREIWNLYCGSIYGYIRDGYWERIRQHSPIWMVQLSLGPIFWGELEFQGRIFIAGLQPVIQPKQSRGLRRGSGDLIWMEWFIHHLMRFLKQIEDLNRESSYLVCSPCYSCFSVLTLKMGLTRVASNADVYISSGFIFWGESEFAIRIPKFLLCHPLWPYLCVITISNIESVIANALTVKNVIPCTTA